MPTHPLHGGVARAAALVTVTVVTLGALHVTAWGSAPATTTVAGDGTAGFAGDGGPGPTARLSGPAGVAVDGAGNVVVADTANNRVRRVDAATGVITTLAGDGKPAFAGDGGPATRAQLNGPSGVAVDGAGNVVVADTANNRVRRVGGDTGVINTLAGDGTAGFAGDDGAGASARLSGPAGVAVTRTGNVVIADTANQRIRRLDAATGRVTTLAGDGLGAVPAPQGPSGPLSGTAQGPSGPLSGTAQGPSGPLSGTAQGPSGPLSGTAAGDPPAGPRGVAVDKAGATLVANTARNRIDRVESPFEPGAPVAQPTAPAGNTSVCDLVGAPDRAAGTVSVDTSTAAPGQELALQGNGFKPGDRLTVTLCSTPRLLGAITADPAGAYRASVRIPADAALGSHHLVISDGRGNAAVALTVAQTDDPEDPYIGGRSGVNGGADGESDPELSVEPMTDEELAEEDARLQAELDAAELQDEIDAGLAADAEFAAGLADSGIPTTGGDFGTLLKLASLSLVSGLVLAFRARRSSTS